MCTVPRRALRCRIFICNDILIWGVKVKGIVILVLFSLFGKQEVRSDFQPVPLLGTGRTLPYSQVSWPCQIHGGRMETEGLQPHPWLELEWTLRADPHADTHKVQSIRQTTAREQGTNAFLEELTTGEREKSRCLWAIVLGSYQDRDLGTRRQNLNTNAVQASLGSRAI